MGRLKTLSALALLGFVIGTASYIVFDFATSIDLYDHSASVTWFFEVSRDLISSPWFISGLLGSVLVMAIAIAIAYITPRR
jgi:hypothetical protein